MSGTVPVPGNKSRLVFLKGWTLQQSKNSEPTPALSGCSGVGSLLLLEPPTFSLPSPDGDSDAHPQLGALPVASFTGKHPGVPWCSSFPKRAGKALADSSMKTWKSCPTKKRGLNSNSVAWAAFPSSLSLNGCLSVLLSYGQGLLLHSTRFSPLCIHAPAPRKVA